MKLYFFRGAAPNFGDELNPWMWPKLLPDFFDEVLDPLFLGIGSILFDYHPADPLKIVMGSGYGGYTPPPEIDGKWRIFFVRGPRTASTLRLDPSKAIADSALYLRTMNIARPPKRYRASFMPHWESLSVGQWPKVANHAGLHFIDPRWEVPEVLDHILASEMIVTEAMHGAIVADALRVPFIALHPQQPSHHFKWIDWSEALDIKLRFNPLEPSTFQERLWIRFGQNKKWRDRFYVRGAMLRHVGNDWHLDRAIKSLSAAVRSEPQLSTETAIERATSRMSDALEQLKAQFGK